MKRCAALLLTIFATSALGADDDPDAPKPKWGAAFRYGLVAGDAAGPGIDIMKQVSDDDDDPWIALTLLTGKYDAKHDLDVGPLVNVTKADVNATLLLIQARAFCGDSFMVSAGIGQRTVTYEFDLQDRTSIGRITGSTKSDSFVGTVMVGNMWRWDSGFFLGADWAGFAAPMSSGFEAKTETIADSETAETAQQSAERSAKSTGSSTSYMALMLTIGGSW